VARLLGGPCHTIGRWLARYAAGGLEAWLATHVPTGTPVSRAPAVLASLEHALHRPEGLASDAALRPWRRQTHGVEVQDNTLDTLVRVRFKAKLNVARPSHTKKTPEAMPACQAACGARLQEVIPPANTRPVRGFSQDERRFGLLTSRRRRLTARGGPPVGSVQPGFAWGDVDGAVEPTTGARVFLELPYLHAAMCPRFVNDVAQAFPDRLHSLLLDNSGAHTSSQLTLPEHVRGVF
jgi:hypothetical protein